MIVVEEEMIDTVAHWIDQVGALLTTEAARIVLRDRIRAMVRAGTLPTMQVIEAARAGHEEADMALRELSVEMLDRGELPPAALRAYAQEALIKPPATYPAGRNIADTWLRDVKGVRSHETFASRFEGPTAVQCLSLHALPVGPKSSAEVSALPRHGSSRNRPPHSALS
jgi:hypothetical protein